MSYWSFSPVPPAVAQQAQRQADAIKAQAAAEKAAQQPQIVTPLAQPVEAPIWGGPTVFDKLWNKLFSSSRSSTTLPAPSGPSGVSTAPANQP